MPRYKLTIEFDGTAYAGWQRQKNDITIQEAVEASIAAFSGENVTVSSAGRTDSGVHAMAMAAHMDLTKEYDAYRVMEAMNYHLRPHPIAIVAARQVTGEFHARFSCLARHYEYHIVNRRAPLTLGITKAWRVSSQLNEAIMHKAAQYLVGTHDFTTFRASQCQAKTPVKTFGGIEVVRSGETVLVKCHARSFLHHQVRSIVGSLVEVGRGRWTPHQFHVALKAADRTACGPVAPPDGLYFVKADY